MAFLTGCGGVRRIQIGIDPAEDYEGYWDENNTYTMDAVFQVEESFHDFGN